MTYNKVTSEDIRALKNIVGEDRCITGGDISPDYGHDEMGGSSGMPEVLVKVKTKEEIAKVLSYANGRHIPVVTRGSGTGLMGGSVAVMGGIMLETTLMNKILELDAENLTVTVEPGVLLMELSAFCEANGFFYPPDPGEKAATLGGNISTNAGGMRAVKYGVTREYVRGLTVVTVDGQTLKLGGKVVKNSSGYALKDLIVGSEGTLAVVAEATLKILPLPTVTVSLLVPFRSLDEAVATVPDIVKGKALPTAIEYISQSIILFAEEYLGKKFPDNKHPGYLLLTFDGYDEAQVEREYSAVADLCLEHGAIDVYIVDTEERRASVWSARSAFLNAIKGTTPEVEEADIVVPRSMVGAFIRFSEQVAKEEGIRVSSFGHAGDGNIHINLCRDDLSEHEWHRRLKAAFDRMYEKAAEIGGQVSGEHGIGYSKRDYFRLQHGDYYVELMARIKTAFDPNGILNPQKVI